MSLLASIPFIGRKAPALRQVLSADWQDRSEVKEVDVNLFCWQRELSAALAAYVQHLLEVPLPPIRQPLHLDQLEQDLGQARASWGTTTNMEGADAFWADVYALCSDFLRLSASSTVTAHLKVIDHNACTKFHIDAYRLRLLTTYVGEGTEWLPETAVNRSALGTSNERIVKDPSQVQQMQAGVVAILKGEAAFAERRTKGIVHRSPQIAETGQKRLVLRLDL